MSVNNPLVSVIIPTYNRPKYVLRAIRSVVNQTYPNIEIIVVDDHSPIDISEIKKTFPQITLLQNSDNKGASYSRNRGIEQAKGDFINFLDDDDILFPSKIEKQVHLFNTSDDPKLGFVTCHTKDQRSGSTVIKYNRIKGNIYKKLLASFVISGIESVLYKKSIIERAGGFDERLQSSQEYDLLIRASKHCTVDFVDDVLTQEFKSVDQINTNFSKKISGAKRIFKKYDNEYRSQGFLFWLRMKAKRTALLFRFIVGKYLGEKTYRFLLFEKK